MKLNQQHMDKLLALADSKRRGKCSMRDILLAEKELTQSIPLPCMLPESLVRECNLKDGRELVDFLFTIGSDRIATRPIAGLCRHRKTGNLETEIAKHLEWFSYVKISPAVCEEIASRINSLDPNRGISCSIPYLLFDNPDALSILLILLGTATAPRWLMNDLSSHFSRRKRIPSHIRRRTAVLLSTIKPHIPDLDYFDLYINLARIAGPLSTHFVHAENILVENLKNSTMAMHYSNLLTLYTIPECNKSSRSIRKASNQDCRQSRLRSAVSLHPFRRAIIARSRMVTDLLDYALSNVRITNSDAHRLGLLLSLLQSSTAKITDAFRNHCILRYQESPNSGCFNMDVADGMFEGLMKSTFHDTLPIHLLKKNEIAIIPKPNMNRQIFCCLLLNRPVCIRAPFRTVIDEPDYYIIGHSESHVCEEFFDLQTIGFVITRND